MPLYESMLQIFNENISYAEEQTVELYKEFQRFVDISQRDLSDTMSSRTIENLGYTEEHLKPFYHDIETQYLQLRDMVKYGDYRTFFSPITRFFIRKIEHCEQKSLAPADISDS